jgi:hypothetical protein
MSWLFDHTEIGYQTQTQMHTCMQTSQPWSRVCAQVTCTHAQSPACDVSKHTQSHTRIRTRTRAVYDYGRFNTSLASTPKHRPSTAPASRSSRKQCSIYIYIFIYIYALVCRCWRREVRSALKGQHAQQRSLMRRTLPTYACMSLLSVLCLVHPSVCLSHLCERNYERAMSFLSIVRYRRIVCVGLLIRLCIRSARMCMQLPYSTDTCSCLPWPWQ